MIKKIVWITAALVVFGCSTAPENTQEMQAPTVDTAGIVASDVVETTSAPVMMPFKVAINADSDDDGVTLTISVDYIDEMADATQLTVEWNEGTSLVEGVVWRKDGSKGTIKHGLNRLVEDVDPVSAGTHLTRQIKVSGEDPNVEVRLGWFAEGLAVEMREGWPPKINTHMNKFDSMKTLEHPVEVNGVLVDKSVEIKPKKRNTEE